MEYLSSAHGIEKFVLIGYCSGADLALEVASKDVSVAGAVLINGFYFRGMRPEGAASEMYASFLARNLSKHLLNIRSWRRVVARKKDLYKFLLILRHKLHRVEPRGVSACAESGRESTWDAVVERGADLLLVYSEGSAAYDRFRLTFEEGLRALGPSSRLQIEVAEQTDHLFTPKSQQEYLISLVCRWIGDDARNWRA
jgi:pimeloyl-ACP methyl ester carboxylesterase